MRKQIGLAAIAAVAGLAGTASAANPGTGWNVQVYYNLPAGGPNSIAETQADIAAHGPADSTATPAVINYVGNGGDGDIGGGVTPPGYVGGNMDHYAITADGYVTGLSGPTAVTLNVNSDDGFGFYQNGTLIGSFDGNRGPSDTQFGATVSNGDHLQLVYFENGGGDEVEVYESTPSNGNQLVNNGASTFGVNTSVPEPASIGLLAFGAGGLMLRRRRA